MNIERLELAHELLKKSSEVEFYINKDVYEYYDVQEIIEKIQKQYGVIVNVFFKDMMVHISVEVEQ